jgi:signal peptidase I
MKNPQAATRATNGNADAERNQERGTGKAERAYRKSTAREYFESICVAVILALFVRTFVVQAFKIPTGSMENNLLIGDHLLVNKFVFAPTVSGAERTVLPIDPIRRGDIIVFKYPEEPERDFIKRVIGLPGETIELRNKRVYIDNKPLDEPYVHFLFPPGENEGDRELTDFDVRRRYGPVTVPQGHYFMMGDNRDNSQDSRYWGFLPREYVKGKALFVYFSFGEEPGLFSGVRWSRILHQIH